MSSIADRVIGCVSYHTNKQKHALKRNKIYTTGVISEAGTTYLSGAPE
jgi:hypothetical protein